MAGKTGRVLHLLSQKPGQTGSGVTLESLAGRAAMSGWEQAALVGLAADDPAPSLAGIAAGATRCLRFGTGELGFPLPGMSDVMPYPSSRFAALTPAQLAAYDAAWRREVAAAVADFRPDLIHSNHVWLLSALIKDVAPALPVFTTCHATGLRQLALCPHLAPAVRAGCARNERFGVLHAGDARALADALGVPQARIRHVGVGYAEERFHRDGRDESPRPTLLYVGKLSAAKGLAQLIDACDLLSGALPDLRLHVAGGGGGQEAAALRERLASMGERAVLHGQLAPDALADLMRRSRVCVLPSYYEGVPLVLVEALACGCRLVATGLPGVREGLAGPLGDALALVPAPAMAGIDTPEPAALPGFSAALAAALADALASPPLAEAGYDFATALAPFGWGAVFARVERVWLELVAGAAGPPGSPH